LCILNLFKQDKPDWEETMQMDRRSFLRATWGTTVAVALGGRAALWGAQAKRANDLVYLGPDKVKLSRLAMGTGTIGGSVQRKLGLQGLADYLEFGTDQGIIFWDTADAYKTHPHVKEALKRVPREKVAIMTKTHANTADEMKSNLDRYRQEMGTDYIDILLLHAVTSPTWPQDMQGAMEYLSEAREKGIVRTHGLSCHSLGALQTAARTPWAHVVLSRLNPAGMRMDGDPAAIVSVYRDFKAAGKGVIGMKILGEGGLRDKVDDSLRFALSLDCMDCFTIGAADRNELSDLIQRIPAASQMAMAA
jgi:predicted aldo/keto reductase-like oxidoreductase